MKPTSLLVFAFCAGLPALAQIPALTVTSASGESSLTLYGVLDAGLARVDHTLGFEPNSSVAVNVQANAHGNTAAIGVLNGGLSGTRWGLKGGTTLGNGFKALFDLESGINLGEGTVSNGAIGLAQTTGLGTAQYTSLDSSLSGQLFGRAAFFGVASDRFGTLTIGRQQSLFFDVLPGYEALGLAQMFTPLGFSGSYLGGGETDSIRVDNALKYRIQIAQFTVALQHKFGGVTGDANAKTSDQAMVNYESGPFGVTLGYEGFKDTTVTANGAASAPGTVAVSFYDTVAYTLAARYQVGKLAIKGGYEKEEITNPSDPAGDASTTSIYGQVVSAVNVHPMTINGSPVQKNVNVFWIGAGYDVTPRFNVAYGYYQLAQQNFQNGGSTAGDASGKSKFDSILLDYKFTKSFDTYAGYMVNVVSGGLAAGYVYPNNSIIGVGARYFF